MSQSLSGSLFNQRVKGMFGGPRDTKGNDGTGDLSLTSGTTYGGQGLGWFWQGYPAVIGGLTEYDPNALQPGSNMDAVNPAISELARDAGEPSANTTGYTSGGTTF